jgi:hypothetical protein
MRYKTESSPTKTANKRLIETKKVKSLIESSPSFHPLPLSQMKSVKSLFNKRLVKIINNNRQPFNSSPLLYPCKKSSPLHTSNSRRIGVFRNGRQILIMNSQSVKSEIRVFTESSLSLHNFEYFPENNLSCSLATCDNCPHKQSRPFSGSLDYSLGNNSTITIIHDSSRYSRGVKL